MVIIGRLIVRAPVGDGGFHWGERAKATAWQSVELYMEYCEDNSNLSNSNGPAVPDGSRTGAFAYNP